MMGKIYYLPVPSRTYRYDYLLGMFTRGILQVGSGTFYGSIGVAYDIVSDQVGNPEDRFYHNEAQIKR